MKLLTEGYWKTKSKEDPRFNMEGEGLVGGFVSPPEAKKAIERKEEELGVESPDDLKISYHKY